MAKMNANQTMNEHKTSALSIAPASSPTNSVLDERFARHSSTAC
jgi:hypothetical protein